MSQKFVDLLQRFVSQEVRMAAAFRLLDWLGCATVGAGEPQGKAVAAYANSLPQGPVSCIGAGEREASVAAFVNGALGNILEMDDLHRMAIVHPADTIIPAALAVAQRENSTPQALLTAVVRGYEAAIRIGEAAGADHYQYWYSTSTCGVFGAAVAAASLLECDSGQLADAIGLAGMQASGLWQCRLEDGYAKQLATARAAQSGVIAADLAVRGFPAPHQIIEGELGFLVATAARQSTEALESNPSAPWKILEVSEKPWPGCRHTHPVIEAALRYREDVALESIERVEIYTYKSAVEFCNDVTPDTPHRARFSLQHAFAVSFLKGEPLLTDYEGHLLNDSPIRTLREKVVVSESTPISRQFPYRFGCEVWLYTQSGECYQQTIISAKGDPENPVDTAARLNKFWRLMAHAGVADEQVASFEQAILQLPFSNSTDELFKLLGSLSRLRE
ncbi:MmgE/PrpD family protein [Marinobacterium arenosum]|uniref:MmgE/PrpD family protein n=1 Tax=Marinobacterium arenosum TaxID=2862496 RepID=UPI001C94F41D|nr:MmgE/PrpD family protein [Marinobacterium arenosum]MBY4678781.1 MmgE/PrpD family protein [Marinobacterium arenosum]